MLKKMMFVGAVALTVAGCQTNSSEDRALAGAGIGAATGAVVGAAATGTAGGAATGAVAGAAGGAIIGAATTPRDCYAYNRYGERYRVACQ